MTGFESWGPPSPPRADQQTVTVTTTAPPRPVSPVGAALLNLTGLSLGYAYRRRWPRFGIHLAVSAILVAVAFATGAAWAPWPWRVVAVLWVGWQVVDAWRLARRDAAGSEGRPLLPVAVGALLVAVVVAGYVGYGVAGRAEFAVGRAAQERADCAAAVGSFDAVSGPYELTLSRDVVAADRGGVECRDYLAATAARDQGRPDQSIDRLRTFRATYPTSVLEPFVAQDLAAGLLSRATASLPGLRSAAAGDRVALTRSAVDDLVAVRRELPGTASAPRVPAALGATYAAAVAPASSKRYCDVLPVLEYMVGVPQADAAEVRTPATPARVQSLLECGRERYRAKDYTGLTVPLNTLVSTYPKDPATASARSLLVTGRVAAAKRGGAAPPLPAPAGAVPPGSVDVTFYNGTTAPIRVLLAGSTATEFTQPACVGCAPPPPGGDPCANALGQPPTTVRLGPGEFDVLVLRGPSQTPDVERLSGTVQGSEFCYVPNGP